MSKSITQSSTWQALQQKSQQAQQQPISALFAANPERASQFSLKLEQFYFDYSKNRLDQETFGLLMQLARESGLNDWREKMFKGDKINHTEQRAVLHTALRYSGSEPILVDGEDVMPAVRAEREHMREFVSQVHSGSWRGYSGKTITDVVNIGIGGSDLGPKLVSEALRPYWVDSLRVHFVSNLDGTHIATTLADLDPETTLFIIASKTFTTLETTYEAESARQWFLSHAQDEAHIAKHFVALSTNTEKVTAFGISTDNMFAFWDWVGGRYSLWSVIGLSIALAVGYDNFEQLLAGAEFMDQHFSHAEAEQNMPVIMAMLGIWHRNFCGIESKAILPYELLLAELPNFLQQLDMESNGKRIDREGNPVDYATGPVIWGGPGSNGQHAFFQHLHQSDTTVCLDFIGTVNSGFPLRDHQTLVLSNMIAQAEAFMQGRSQQQVLDRLDPAAPGYAHQQAISLFRSFEGGVPSNTILIDKLSPFNLGALLAMYEHTVFVQGVVWNINSFDQWGVELGKELAQKIIAEFHNGIDLDAHDSSTVALMQHFKAGYQEPK